MQPGLVVKLRPAGPWRIGPDSGARNRVDAIYHSDSLYAAVTGAMARLGSLEAWLDATARPAGAPAVCFSSCFPFLDEIGFVVPPRTVWPPTSPAQLSARVRWKSARFVPLGIVQAVLAGQKLDDSQWSVDGPSECLVPAGRPGPFRTGIRSSAAVDRLTGATERHSTACIEFRPGAGLWAVVSFADEAARDRWSDPVKTCLRWLADTGFGGERSRGWGRSEPPEFIEGALPEMILGGQGPGARSQGAEASAEVRTKPALELLVTPEPEPVTDTEAQAPEEPAVAAEPAIEAEAPGPWPPAPEAQAPEESAVVTEPAPEAEAPTPGPWPPAPETPPAPEAPAPEEPMIAEPAAEAEAPAPGPRSPAPVPAPVNGVHAHWLLSLFTPAPGDSLDWARGDYVLVERGGRVDSPVRSGELKKQVRMVAEGSVVYAAVAPCGSASDVAPDGFPHPVYRAGFALSIPLPEVS
jgi:CRISPR type III-A-associated RAMP protein Csm4